MENPEEKIQQGLLERIITNVSQLNSNLVQVNQVLEDIDEDNERIVLVNELWENYKKNADYHMSRTASRYTTESTTK